MATSGSSKGDRRSSSSLNNGGSGGNTLLITDRRTKDERAKRSLETTKRRPSIFSGLGTRGRGLLWLAGRKQKKARALKDAQSQIEKSEVFDDLSGLSDLSEEDDIEEVPNVDQSERTGSRGGGHGTQLDQGPKIATPISGADGGRGLGRNHRLSGERLLPPEAFKHNNDDTPKTKGVCNSTSPIHSRGRSAEGTFFLEEVPTISEGKCLQEEDSTTSELRPNVNAGGSVIDTYRNEDTEKFGSSDSPSGDEVEAATNSKDRDEVLGLSDYDGIFTNEGVLDLDNVTPGKREVAESSKALDKNSPSGVSQTQMSEVFENLSDFSEDDDLDEMCKAKYLLNDNVDRSEATAEESEGNGVSDGESEPNGSDQKSSERLQPPEAFKRNKVKVRYLNSVTCR